VTVQATAPNVITFSSIGQLANASVRQFVASGCHRRRALVTTTIKDHTIQIVNIGGSGGGGVDTFTLSYGGQTPPVRVDGRRRTDPGKCWRA
jgi:hypothetical protein